MKVFTVPSCIPKLKEPYITFNLSPPTYHKITRIIKRMKSSGSPCPLDQVSIICFKWYPYLRYQIFALKYLEAIPYQYNGPKLSPFWFIKKVTLVLKPVSLKIFTLLLRNRVFTYLINNQYIEIHYQKGFMPGMSGTFEHIAQNESHHDHSRKQQRSVTITLIDLENAFGEVHHSLIQSVLRYH